MEIINDNWTCKAWYENEYTKFLEEYVKRAEYIAPPWYSEHQTWKAFDMKILCKSGNYEGIEVMLWDKNLLPWVIHDEVDSELSKSWFINSYSREPRHWRYTN